MSGVILVSRVPAGTYAGRDAAFAALWSRAEAPNPHMAPAAVGAALASGVPEREIAVLEARAAPDGPLVGVWALRSQAGLRSGFAPVLTAPLVPLYETSSAPVLDRDHAMAAGRALLAAILDDPALPKVLSLPLLPLHGQAAHALEAGLAALGGHMWRFEHWQRPMLIPHADEDATAYLRRALGSGYKKRMQQHRQLRKAGDLAYTRHRGADAVAALDTLLALEASGWKGRAGTALAQRPHDAAYIREIVARFAAVDAVRIDLLDLDGQPLAGGLLLDRAGRSHFIKIAYDESRARLSPGRALAIAMLQADFAAGTPFSLDSGAGDGVDAAPYPWAERQPMANVLVTFGSIGDLRPRLAAQARALLRRWRARLRG